VSEGETVRKGSAFEFLYLALAHWRLGQKEKAQECYRQAEQWVAANAALLEKQAQLRADLSRLQEGARHFLHPQAGAAPPRDP
jgi:hypothetical protein